MRRAVALALCAACLCLSGLHALQTKDLLDDRPDVISATREADLEAYALEHPDQLILRTPDLLRDTRLLPDVSEGMPVNLMIWGDWYCRTPSWYNQLAAFGIDGRTFTAADWLRPNLLFATNEAQPPQALLTYLTEGCGRAITAAQVGSRGELRFFQFR